MSRETASSRIAWVEGPNAVRSARRMNVSRSFSQSNSGVGLDEVVHQAYGEPGRREADLLVDVPVDDVVAALLPLDLAGLAAADVVADLLLQGERGVLGDVAEPGALVQALHEAAAAAAGAGVLAQPGQHLEQVLGEAGQRVGREVLERAEVDHEVDGLVVGPDVGAPVDPGLQDRQVGGRGAHASVSFGRLAGAAAPQHGGGDVARGDVTSQPFQVAARNRELLGLAGVDLRRLPDEGLLGEVEHGARGQHVHHHAGGEQRCGTAGLVGVGDHVAAVEDRHHAAADHPHDLLAVLLGDHRAGVLVDADAEQAGALRDQHQQPSVAVALAEVLVDDHVADQAEAGGELGHPLLGGRPAGAEGDHVRGLDARAGAGAADHDAAAVGGLDRLAERGAVDDRGQLELVAAGHEDAGHVVEQADHLGVLGLLAALGPCGDDVGRAELAEQRVVHLDDLGAERAGGGDDRDLGVLATGQRDEGLEHGASAELVLGTTDRDERSRSCRWSSAPVSACCQLDRSACSAAYGVRELGS